MSMRRYLVITLLLLACPVVAAPPAKVLRLLPATPQDCTTKQASLFAKAARNWIDRAANEEPEDDSAKAQLKNVDNWLLWQRQVDRGLNQWLDRAGELSKLDASAARTQAVQAYLQMCQSLIDLSGRLRYVSRDVVQSTAEELDLADYRKLINLVGTHRSSAATDVLTYALFDPDEKGREPYPAAIKHRILDLVAKANRIELLDAVAEYVMEKNQSPGLIVHATEVIRQLGLPQDPHPSHPSWVAKPSITAAKLHQVVVGLKVTQSALRVRQENLIQWLKQRMQRGVLGNEFRLGNMILREGDWFLMKNPSPYNEFTNIAPGLFSHVGVVATTTTKEGIRRFVIVDLPERGSTVPAINVDAYLERTLHYAFVRHPNKAIGRQLGAAAASLIGRPSQFDLTFKTSRVEAVRGKLKQMKRVNTYCAGFLLLCAQETNAPLHHFFPIVERTADGHCAANLKKLGINFGKNFVSPTGPLFSQTLKRVGMREPTYGPLRDIKDQIYAHFCRQMKATKIRPTPTTLQRVRQNIANLSKFNPWLAKALAKASNVSAHMDLAAAAKAAAVIETLDGIAKHSTDEFFASKDAISESESDSLSEIPARFRAIHKRLFMRWRNDELTPRDLRVALVNYYAAWGKAQLEKRFFGK